MQTLRLGLVVASGRKDHWRCGNDRHPHGPRPLAGSAARMRAVGRGPTEGREPPKCLLDEGVSVRSWWLNEQTPERQFMPARDPNVDLQD